MAQALQDSARQGTANSGPKGAAHGRWGQRHRPQRAAQGGRPLPARPRRIHRRYPPARHAGPRLRAQPAGPCAHPRHPRPGRRRRVRLHRRGPRCPSDAGRFRPARLQDLRPARARAGQGAPCRRTPRRLRRRHPRRGRRSRRRRHDRLRRAAGRGRHAGSPSPRRAAAARALGRQRLPGDGGGGRPCRHPRQRADRGAPQFSHCAAMHVAAGRTRRGGRLGPPAGATAGLQLHAIAAHRAHRAGGVPRS